MQNPHAVPFAMKPQQPQPLGKGLPPIKELVGKAANQRQNQMNKFMQKWNQNQVQAQGANQMQVDEGGRRRRRTKKGKKARRYTRRR